ncbi:MAG TPA: hypothetical protein VHN14_29650 [Kofleriaceae bacterium]|jgi:hypothetical protein|nr:hypothetical protein [Kofleriaceae bacterium]
MVVDYMRCTLPECRRSWVAMCGNAANRVPEKTAPYSQNLAIDVHAGALVDDATEFLTDARVAEITVPIAADRGHRHPC